jgi:hypothetical protein
VRFEVAFGCMRNSRAGEVVKTQTPLPPHAIPHADIPDDPELAGDLTAPGFETARGKRFHGTIQLEHKDDLKARGEASPDDGDTLP